MVIHTSPLSVFEACLCIPLTLQGKCATGITKKLKRLTNFHAYPREQLPVRVIQDTCKRVIPCKEGSEQAKNASSRDDGWVWCTSRVAGKIADAEQQKRHIEGEEQQEECDSRSQSGHEHEEGKDKPALGKHQLNQKSLCQSFLTIRNRPNESRKAGSVAPPRESTIWNPPGVRIMPKAIQKPPYEDSAVAPNVLPTAISLGQRQRGGL